MRFREILQYELAYRVRSASTWLYGGFLFLLSFWVIHVAVTGTNPVYVNAPQPIAKTAALFCGLFGMLVTAGLVSDAALRDRAVRMDPLLFTTRLRTAEYLGGRFLAALATNAMLVFAIPLGLSLATMMPYLPQEALGPNRLAAYLQPLVLFVLPNLVLIAAILFGIAVLTRQVVAVYIGAIVILIGYVVAANYWGDISSPILAGLADPLGVNALDKMTEYWTAAERNTTLIGFPAVLLWNRLLWITVAVAVLFFVQRIFRFEEREARGRAAQRIDAPDEVRSRVAVPQVSGSFGRRTRLAQTLAVTRDSLAEVMSGRAFQVAFVAAIGLVILWGWNIGETRFETITWPVTHLVAGVVLTQRAVLVPWLVIALYAGELVWRNRETGAAEIADAVPVRTATVLIGRFLALVTLIAIFQFAFLIGGILLQVMHGYYVFELDLYAKILFGIKFADYVVLAALAMTVHVLVNHKYVGHAAVLMTIIFTTSAQYGIHHLFVYNSGPAWTYSEMNALEPFTTQFVWFKLYWAAWALLLGVIAFLFWVRGPELGIRQRLATARARFTGRSAQLALTAVVLIFAFGGFIFYNTNVLNQHLPPHKAGAPQAEYERRYSKYRDLPQPVITGADLRFEIYPERPALDMQGTYRLVNRTGVPIRSVHIETPNGSDYEVRSMTFDRDAKPELVDADHGYRIFTLARPLAPGESVRFSFNVALQPRGFPHGGGQTTVVANGTYFDRRLLPFIGYQPVFEIESEQERKKYGLPPKQILPAADDPNARKYQSVVRDGDRIRIETIVGTSADQIAVVPGVLRRSWTENGRRYFHYGTRQPETFGTAVFSARYAVHRGQWNPPAGKGEPVMLEILHHPQHRATLERMTAAMKASLDYYTAAFGPYPYRELRIIEVPPYSINARAFPSAMAMGEQNFITRSEPDMVDLTFFGTAHEIAHQWWGGQIRPAFAQGRGFVSESLANYSAMLVTEKVLGPEKARLVYDFQMNRYLTSRGETGADDALLRVGEQPHVEYGKGAVALYTLHEHIGAEAMNVALRRLLEKFGSSGPPYATSLDLYAELRAVTPPELHPLLTDLFETVTLWNVKTERAVTRRLPDGRHEVTLDVFAQKLRADDGTETPTPMNDLIEVAVFTEGKDEPIQLTRQRIRSGRQTLRLVVSQEPSRAGLDPKQKLIERDRNDNVIEVTTRG